MKVIFIFAAVLATTSAFLDDLPWTKAINAKLCEPGSHTDAISKEFYACYDETIVPGADAFIKCQDSIYDVQMNNEANVEKVCGASKLKFPLYAGCIVSKLVFKGVDVADSMHKLNVCQGAVMGVPQPA